MRARLIALSLLVLAGLLVSTSSAATTDPKKMVLTLADLPAGFALAKGYYADNARAAKESKNQTVADFTRWGRTNGYEADFKRSAITGILEIDSSASTYKTAKGAADSTHDSYAAGEKPQLLDGKKVAFKRVSTGARIGHEARMYSLDVKSQGLSVTFYAVVWRYGTVKSALLVGGLTGTVDAAVAVKLAQKQQARIASASK